MTQAHLTEWTCDGCRTTETWPNDGLMPRGWTRSMVGDDLCSECRIN